MKNERKMGILLNYVLLFLNNFIALIYMPFMIRMLGQSEYGLYSLISSIIGYLTVLDLGFGNALIIYITKYREQKKELELQKLYNMFLTIYSIISILTVIIGLILYGFSDKLFMTSMTITELKKAKIMLLILIFNLAVTFPFTIYSSIITANEKFIFQKVIAIIRTILNPIIMLPLLLLGYKSIAMVVVITILNISSLICNYLYCKRKLNINIKLGKIDFKLFKEIFKYSFFIFINVIIDKINWNIDQFILGSIKGTVAVSIYAVASQFNSMYLNFSTAISTVLLPKVTKMVTNNVSSEELTNEFVKTSRIQYLILFIIITGYIIFGYDFIILWAGKEYADAYYIGLLLMVPLTIPLTQNLGISIMQAKNMHRFRSLVLIIIAILNVIISIPLAKVYSGIGTAIGTCLSLIIGNIIIINFYYYYKVKINIKKYWKNMLQITIKEFPIFILILAFASFTKFTIIYKLIIWIPIYIIIYIIYTYLFVMNEEEKERIKRVEQKILNLTKRKKQL